MKLQVFAIYDSKVKDFANPFFMHSKGELQRGFTELVNDPKTKLNKYPEDFSVFHLGEYNSESGALIPLQAPERLFTALEVINTQN